VRVSRTVRRILTVPAARYEAIEEQLNSISLVSEAESMVGQLGQMAELGPRGANNNNGQVANANQGELEQLAAETEQGASALGTAVRFAGCSERRFEGSSAGGSAVAGINRQDDASPAGAENGNENGNENSAENCAENGNENGAENGTETSKVPRPRSLAGRQLVLELRPTALH